MAGPNSRHGRLRRMDREERPDYLPPGEPDLRLRFAAFLMADPQFASVPVGAIKELSAFVERAVEQRVRGLIELSSEARR
jgi:hypothetical protein